MAGDRAALLRLTRGAAGLRTGPTAMLLDHVLAGATEAALVYGPVIYPDFAVGRVYAEELVVLSGRGSGGLTCFRTSHQLRIIVLNRRCSYPQHLEALLLRRSVVAFQVAELSSVNAVLSCVSAGVGVSLLPEALVDQYAHRYELRTGQLPTGKSMMDTALIRRGRVPFSGAIWGFAAYPPSAATQMRAG